MSVGLKHANFDSKSQTNSMQMTHNRLNDLHHVLFETLHHGQFLQFHVMDHLPQPPGSVTHIHLDLQVWWLHINVSWCHKSLTCDEPLDRIDEHGAQRPKTLSSLFCVDKSRFGLWVFSGNPNSESWCSGQNEHQTNVLCNFFNAFIL